MKRWYVWTTLVAIVLASVFFVTWIIVNPNHLAEDHEIEQLEDGEEQIVNDDVVSVGGTSGTILAQYKEKGLNPFGDPLKMDELNDSLMQDYIHGMSHQKVKAQKKWGFYAIHTNRIDWLIRSLDVRDHEFKYESIYNQILTRWKNGDFSTIDQDHNTIWSLQGGTVGRATGILSPKEEKAYLNQVDPEERKISFKN